MSMAQTGVSSDHRFMKAWNEFCATDEFKNALRWAVETKYDDGREISDINREQHAKGAMWLALTRGMEAQAEELADAKTRNYKLRADALEAEVQVQADTLAKLREALTDLICCNEEWNAAVESVIGRPAGWNENYLTRAKAALEATK